MNTEQIKRGERAKELLQDPLIVEFWNSIVNQLNATIAAAKVGDSAKIEDLLRQRDVIKQMREFFQREINRATIELKKQEKL